MCIQQELWYYNYTTNNSTFHYRRLSVILEALTLLLILTVALSANLFAIVAILKSYNGRNIHYIFILNLFITDLGITLACMLFALYDVFNPGYIKCFDILCKVQNYMGLVFHLSNVFAVCLIAIHRFLGVVVPDRITIRKIHAYVMLGVAWGIPSIVAVFPASGLLSASVYTAGAHACSPDWHDSCPFFILMIIFLYGIALPTMSICYSLIIREIRRSEARLRKTKSRPSPMRPTLAKYQKGRDSLRDTSETNGGQENNNISTVSIQVAMTTNEERESRVSTKQSVKHRRHPTQRRANLSADKRVALTCGLIVSTSFACWTPYFIIHATCAWDLVPSHGLGVFAKWLLFFNSALDPVIYVAFNKRLRTSICKKKLDTEKYTAERRRQSIPAESEFKETNDTERNKN